MEMTLRELLNHVMNRGGATRTCSIISSTFYPEEKNLPKIAEIYTSVFRELLELSPGPVGEHITKDYHIRLVDIKGGELDGEVDVCLYDTSEDKTYACDLVDWIDLIDLMVEDKVGLSLDTQLAHILYELTFWGWNADDVKTSAEELEKTAEEAVEEITPLSGLL